MLCTWHYVRNLETREHASKFTVYHLVRNHSALVSLLVAWILYTVPAVWRGTMTQVQMFQSMVTQLWDRHGVGKDTAEAALHSQRRSREGSKEQQGESPPPKPSPQWQAPLSEPHLQLLSSRNSSMNWSTLPVTFQKFLALNTSDI